MLPLLRALFPRARVALYAFAVLPAPATTRRGLVPEARQEAVGSRQGGAPTARRWPIQRLILLGEAFHARIVLLRYRTVAYEPYRYLY